MINLRRTKGVSKLYLDKTMKDFSYLSAGCLIRAVGHNLKVAYIDTQKKSSKLINVFENLSLSSKFLRALEKIHIETFSFVNSQKVSKGIIPLVEFQMLNQELFWKNLKNFDLIIFDNIDFKYFSKEKLLSFIKNKEYETEIIITTLNEEDFNFFLDDVEMAFFIEEEKTFSLTSNKNIVSIIGNGYGKSVYNLGVLFSNFIEKKDVKLIYFDKGDSFYKEIRFLQALKYFKIQNPNLYGTFDFVQTGVSRYEGPYIRQENSAQDIFEAKEALMLLKTSLKKHTPVIVDNLINSIENGLLSEEEVINVFSNVDNSLFISGNKLSNKISALINKKISIESKRKIISEGLYKGVDF